MAGNFFEMAVLLAVAGVLGLLAHWLRQPLIVAFLAVGIMVGPAGLHWVAIGSEIELLAKTGVALLLFTVGLRLDMNVIRTMGPVSLATGLGQVLFTSLVGYIICLALGLEHLASVYVAVALTFSSTIIIVKLLSDKREIDSLHGRIAVGFLIVQDLVVVLVMIALTALAAPVRSEAWFLDIALVVVKGLALLAVLGLLMRYVIPPVCRMAVRSAELLTVVGIAWAVVLAAVSERLGFSMEVGAFLAGVSLGSMPYRDALAARLVSLRDFLLLFFFVDMGAHLQLGLLGAQLGSAAVLSLFVLIGNPFIVMVIMGAMGYRKRTGFLAGLTVAQISEFSLMLAALGLGLGHIGADIVGLITLVGLVTITLSTYMILYSHPLYERLAPWLQRFERADPFRELALDTAPEHMPKVDVVIFGMGRFGSHITRQLAHHDIHTLGVDFDPELVRRRRRAGHNVVYGDAENPEFAATLPLAEARCVVSTVPQLSVNLVLLHALRNYGYRAHVVTTTHHDHEAQALKEAGSRLVLQPYFHASKEAAEELIKLIG